jgi:hypothetical protein
MHATIHGENTMIVKHRRHPAGRSAFALPLLAAAALATFATAVAAASPRALAAQQVERPAPRPDDVASIDAILTALYDVISGPVGQQRDWDRFRSLFLPGAMLVPTQRAADGRFVHRTMTPEDYAEMSGPSLTQTGFREHEIARVEERYGNIAHAFSTYEAFRGDETESFMRGINSIQLWNDGSRWWILSVFWEAERPDNPLPAKYLPGGR